MKILHGNMQAMDGKASATTLSITTFSITTFSITIFSIMTLSTRQSIVMLSVTQFQLCSVPFTSPFALIAVMLNVVMLFVVALQNLFCQGCKLHA